MKPSRSIKTLRLQRETLAVLTRGELLRVAGGSDGTGGTSYLTCDYSCQPCQYLSVGAC
jgi:hypothetical protein